MSEKVEIVGQGEHLLRYMRRGDQSAREKLLARLPALRNVAEEGDAAAQALVGSISLELLDDPSSALKFFESSAAAGNPTGQRSFGYMLKSGIGIEKDSVRAVELFRSAAEGGDEVAAYNLALMYFEGDGVPIDEAVGLRYLTTAADGGVSEACARLAHKRAYAGRFDEARALAVKAAEGEYPSAIWELACWYRDGIAGDVDRVQAVRWFLRLLGYKNTDGVHEAIQIAREMTDGEIREAAALAGMPGYGEILIEVVRKPQGY